MSRKKIAVLLSAIAAVAAAITAIVLFHEQIAAFFAALSAKLKKAQTPAAPEPDFTDEERECFADI